MDCGGNVNRLDVNNWRANISVWEGFVMNAYITYYNLGSKYSLFIKFGDSLAVKWVSEQRIA